MKYGYFNDAQKEYVITSYKTPLPWINYLGNNDFYSLISNTSGGYSFYKDAKLLRLTRYRYNNTPQDNNGRYYYIKENDTIWNPGWQPTQTPLDSYECHHGLGYTTFFSSKNNLSCNVTAFVPLHDNCEINMVTLKNEGKSEKSFSLFSYIEFCLWDAVNDSSNFQRTFSIGEVEIYPSTIYHKTEFRERRNHYAVYAVNMPVDGYDTSREDFLGLYGSPAKPEVVVNGQSMNSVASGWNPVGSFQKDFILRPGEEVSLVFILGYVEVPADQKWESPNIINKKPATEMLTRYNTTEKAKKALEQLKEYWNTLLSAYTLQSEDEKLNRMVNIWNQYQCMVTFNMSRSASYYESGMSRGMGFRDSCQDLLGFLHLIPDKARQRILDIASTQFEDGSAYHQYQPLTKQGNADIGSGFNDDPLWLIAGVSAYLRETGDYSILDESVAFDCKRELAKPLLVHLERSFHYFDKNLGPHGLPLIGRADWNDCLNLNCFSDTPGEPFQTTGPSEGPVAESVFIAGMYVKYGTEYAIICEKLGLTKEAATVREKVNTMYSQIVKHGWDGDWFLRAYDSTGEKIGSKDCTEGQIFIEPQGMCIMANIGLNDGMARKALDSVKERLDTKYGIVLLQPAYQSYHLNLGEISSYPPGYKENAGIFCHCNPWISIAETKIGRGGQAFDIYQKICPAYTEDISEIHRAEPYVYAQMVAGIDAKNFGEAKNSWLTGTSAWTFVNVSQYILGIQPEYDGLTIDPCVPAHLKEFQIIRNFRGNEYHITIKNPNNASKGVSSMKVGGIKKEGNFIPYEKSDKPIAVEIVLG